MQKELYGRFVLFWNVRESNPDCCDMPRASYPLDHRDEEISKQTQREYGFNPQKPSPYPRYSNNPPVSVVFILSLIAFTRIFGQPHPVPDIAFSISFYPLLCPLFFFKLRRLLFRYENIFCFL